LDCLIFRLANVLPKEAIPEGNKEKGEEDDNAEKKAAHWEKGVMW